MDEFNILLEYLGSIQILINKNNEIGNDDVPILPCKHAIWTGNFTTLDFRDKYPKREWYYKNVEFKLKQVIITGDNENSFNICMECVNEKLKELIG